MKNPFFYLLLLVLVVLDGWLMSHPNLIGRFGVWFYEYEYLRTFPRALATVSAVVGVALLLSWLVSRFPRPIALAGVGVVAGAWPVMVDSKPSAVYVGDL